MHIIKALQNLGLDVKRETGHLFYGNNFKPLTISPHIIFVRHGETYGNCGQCTTNGEIDQVALQQNIKQLEKRVFQGNVDAAINQLTEIGHKQAQQACQLLCKEVEKGFVPDFILHSPLTRAKETALPFINKFNYHDLFLEHPLITEMNFGAWENRRICDFANDHPCHQFYKNQHALIKENSDDLFPKTSTAECFAEVILRAYHVLLELDTLYKSHNIIIFSHSMFGAACMILFGKGMQFENSSHLAFDGKDNNGKSYILPHAQPIFLNSPAPKVKISMLNLKKQY